MATQTRDGGYVSLSYPDYRDLHSLLAYSVSQRTREVAIRVALGARPPDVIALVLRQGMWLLVVGFGIGLSIAYGALPSISPFLIGVSAKDPLTFAAVAAVLAAVALIASCPPAARRASIRSRPCGCDPEGREELTSECHRTAISRTGLPAALPPS